MQTLKRFILIWRSTLILQLASVKYDSIYIPSIAVLNNLGIFSIIPPNHNERALMKSLQ